MAVASHVSRRSCRSWPSGSLTSLLPPLEFLAYFCSRSRVFLPLSSSWTPACFFCVHLRRALATALPCLILSRLQVYPHLWLHRFSARNPPSPPTIKRSVTSFPSPVAMSELSAISSHEEDFYSGTSDHAPSSSPSSHSQCNSSTSILTTAAAQPAQNWEASAASTLGTVWTDSKHSSYLNFMEANFVQSMFGSSHWSDEAHGMMTYEYLQHGSTDDCDDEDSAQSRLHMPYEKMELKMFDHYDQTWKSCARPTLPPCEPLVLLANNPWVRHFWSKKPSTTAPSMPLSPIKDMVTVSSAKDIGIAEHLPRLTTLNDVSGCNPGDAKGRLHAGLRNQWIYKKKLDQTVNARISSSKRRGLWSTYNLVLATRRKVNNDARNCTQIGTNNQDGASPQGLTDGLANL